MCDAADDYSTFHNERVVRARKAHRCLGCREHITVGQPCRYTSGLFEGAIYSYRHCLRCAAMIDALYARMRDGGEQGPIAIDPGLDCGEIWDDPPPAVALLAFLLPGETPDRNALLEATTS